MDRAARDERRAARERRLRRRRRLLLGARAGTVAGLVLLVMNAGGTTPQPPRPAATQPAHVATTRMPVPAGATHALAMPGAHLAPHEAVPVLMYHLVGHRPPTAPYPALWVSPKAFLAQVHTLERAGNHGVTLQRLWDAWHHHGTLPSRPVVFSFDDGSYGQFANALPALARAGWPGVLNLKLGNLNDMGGPETIRRMVRAGWEIDAHTITHPDLTTVDAGRLEHEVAGARARIQREFHVPANFFCYPSGRYDDAVIAAVKHAGYRAATTTKPGWARPDGNPFTLSRVRVDGGMTAQGLVQRIADVRAARGA
jgi:peptidoglycan/xylan/chitin deacetylase (PgdA/CDA1 family)